MSRMAGTDGGGRGGSTALLGVHFEVDTGTPPLLAPGRLKNFQPCSLVEGVREFAMAATEAPAAAGLRYYGPGRGPARKK